MGPSWTGSPAHSASPTQDPHLDKFFTLVHVLEEGAFPFRLKDVVLSEGTVEQELRASLSALRLASPEPLVAFSHHVLDKLVRLVVRPPVISGQMGERGWAQASVSPSREQPPQCSDPQCRLKFTLAYLKNGPGLWHPEQVL